MEKRIIIVDFNHLVYTYQFAPYELTGWREINGEMQQVSVKLHKGITEQINRWAERGYNKVIVCFDNPVPARRAYFAGITGDQGYKQGRKGLSDDTLETIAQIQGILREAGIPVLQGFNYEADDLIFATVCRCKREFPDMPIDIITNDADLLPLVDEQVSVFIRSSKFSRAENPELLKKNYIQVTPDNFEKEVTERGDYKKFRVPYNSILLHKLIRGDKSDNIKGLKGYGPKKYNDLIERMEADGVDFARIFRYGECGLAYRNKKTGQIEQEIDMAEKANYTACYESPQEMQKIISVMENYMTADEVKHIADTYRGMNLNMPFAGSDKNTRRVSARPKDLPSEYDIRLLRQALKKWDITLK